MSVINILLTLSNVTIALLIYIKLCTLIKREEVSSNDILNDLFRIEEKQKRTLESINVSQRNILQLIEGLNTLKVDSVDLSDRIRSKVQHEIASMKKTELPSTSENKLNAASKTRGRPRKNV